jgi:hypothetical protein
VARGSQRRVADEFLTEGKFSGADLRPIAPDFRGKG